MREILFRGKRIDNGERYKEFRKKNAEERDRRYRENEVDRYIGEKYDKAARKARGRRK